MLEYLPRNGSRLEQLLTFAHEELAEPINRLIGDFGQLEPIHTLRPQFSFRPPDWRWQLGLKVLGSGSHIAFRHLLRELEDVLRLQIAVCCGPKVDGVMKACRVPAGAADAMAFVVACQKSPALRTGLIGRLLAGSSTNQIAQALPLEVPVIQAYQHMFLDIAARMKYPSMIVNCIIERCALGNAIERETLLLCYAYGPKVAECLLLDYDPSIPPPKSPEEVEKCLKADTKTTLSRRAAVAMRLLNVDDPRNALQLLKHYDRQQREERRTRGKSASAAKAAK